MEHPTSALIAFLTGELGPAEREQVSAHLAGCAECGREHDAIARLLGDLRASSAATPPVHWGRWQAELRARLQARRPLPLAVSAALVGLLVVMVWWAGQPEPPRPDLAAIEEAALGGRLELLSQYPVLEHLELLEDLELIRQLDRLTPHGEG
jgi:predicted anti-sigma-YlaC factor YlaD